MQKAEQERRRRKNRKCIDTLSKEQEVIKDCEDAEEAFTIRDIHDNTGRKKVIDAAEKQAELIYEKYKNAGIDPETEESILDIELRKVSSEIRKNFKDEGHQREVSRIIHEKFGGKYTRHYTKKEQKLLREGKMREYPECADLTMDLMKSFDKQKRIIRSNVIPHVELGTGEYEEYGIGHTTPRDELDDKTREVRNAAVEWARDNEIPWVYQKKDPWTKTPEDIELPEDNDPTKKRKSLEALPEDQYKKKLEEILGAKLFELRDIIDKIAHDVIDNHYLSDDPKIQEEYTKWIDAWIAFYKPIADKRYTGDWRDWIQPTIDKVFRDNPDPDGLGPLRIDRYKIYSDGTVKSRQTPFTKKHVAGDGMIRNINNVLKIQSNIIFGRGLFDNYRDTKFRQTKKRKKEVKERHPW